MIGTRRSGWGTLNAPSTRWYRPSTVLHRESNIARQMRTASSRRPMRSPIGGNVKP